MTLTATLFARECHFFSFLRKDSRFGAAGRDTLGVRRDFSVYVLINAFSLFDPALIKQLLLDATQGMGHCLRL